MKIWIARPGDTLPAAARRLGLPAEELARLNQLEDPVRLTGGLALAVPEAGEAPRRSLELSAVEELNAPVSALEELAPALSWLCLFCRTAAEGLLSPPAPAERRLLGRARELGLPVMLTLANLDGEGNYSAALAHSLLGTESARRLLLEKLLEALEESGCAGLYLSFCCLHPFDRDSYNAFLRLAAPALHDRGRYLITALAPKEDDSERSLQSSAHDYAVHGACADRVILLAYDWGYAYSAPQAVSPADRIRAVLDYAAGKLPPGKLSLAVSGRGYSWGLPWRLGDRAQALSHRAAAGLAVAAQAEIRLDKASRCSSFRYTDPSGRRREVWFEDLRSLEARLELVEDYGLAGLCLLGGSRPDRAALAYLRSRYIPERLP